MKDSQHQQQQPTQQTLKFIQVSNVKKKSFKRKKYYPNNKSKQSKSATTCNNNSSGETIDNHQHEQSPHVLSTTTCSSSSNNNRIMPSSSSTIIHEMGSSSSDVNLNDINPISSFHSLDGLPQHHLHMSQQQHPSNIRGSQHASSSAEDVSKLSDSSSIEQHTYMHRGGASSPPINNMLSQNINNNNTSGNNASSSPGTCNNNNAASNSLQFVMEASPKYITHVAKKRNTLSKDNLIRVLHLSQVQACKVLGCSLSTLKRRFGEVKQELGMEKWPSYYDDVRHLPIFPKLYPMSLQFILNERDCNDLPTNCDLIFENAAHFSTTFPKPPNYQPTSDE